MTEEKIEYMFVVAKQADGRVAVGNLDNNQGEREPTVDDIYTSAGIIQRDIQVQQTLSGLGQVLANAGAPAPADNRTEGGLVVPGNTPTSKFKKVTRS